eukprot:COSAG02_NODE_48269_length_335_cov_0.639831_1_plen_63_part_01
MGALRRRLYCGTRMLRTVLATYGWLAACATQQTHLRMEDRVFRSRQIFFLGKRDRSFWPLKAI